VKTTSFTSGGGGNKLNHYQTYVDIVGESYGGEVPEPFLSHHEARRDAEAVPLAKEYNRGRITTPTQERYPKNIHNLKQVHVE